MRKRLIARLTLIMLLLSAAACSRAPLGVPGLSLPPGSKIIGRQTSTDHDSSTPTDLTDALKRSHQGDLHLLNVEFDCKAGWDAVDAHIAACLQRQGIADVTSERLTAQRIVPGTPDQWDYYTRAFESTDGKVSIALGSRTRLRDFMLRNGEPAPSLQPGQGDYWLMIFREY
jgi:hypothetical protein